MKLTKQQLKKIIQEELLHKKPTTQNLNEMMVPLQPMMQIDYTEESDESRWMRIAGTKKVTQKLTEQAHTRKSLEEEIVEMASRLSEIGNDMLNGNHETPDRDGFEVYESEEMHHELMNASKVLYQVLKDVGIE
jgi:uncharacterized membrane-anchored protein YjiN (DUF445 family)